MIGLRTIGTFGAIVAFGLGFAMLAENADEFRAEREVARHFADVG